MAEIHKCSECGFLARRNIETGELCEADENIRARGASPRLFDFYPSCSEKIYNLREEIDNEPLAPSAYQRVYTVIQRDRPCNRYSGWQPGTSPAEYRAMQIDDIEKRWKQKIATERWLIGVSVSLLQIIVGVLIWQLS